METNRDEQVMTVTVREPQAKESGRPPKHDPNVSDGLVPISDAHWKIILKLYLRTYRGPHAVEDLKAQLEGYQVLRQSGHVGKGRYVRYLPRGLVDVDLKRGGWVVKCNSTSLHLQDGRRQWRVLRRDNFIFVREQDESIVPVNRYHRKGIIRLLAEEALYQDNRRKEEAEPFQQPRLKANFT